MWYLWYSTPLRPINFNLAAQALQMLQIRVASPNKDVLSTTIKIYIHTYITAVKSGTCRQRRGSRPAPHAAGNGCVAEVQAYQITSSASSGLSHSMQHTHHHVPTAHSLHASCTTPSLQRRHQDPCCRTSRHM